MVHSLPRRHRLAEEDADPFSCRRRPEKGRRQHSVPGGEHVGPDLLSAGRCGGHAHDRVREGRCGGTTAGAGALKESGIVKPELTPDLLNEARKRSAILTPSRQAAKRTA